MAAKTRMQPRTLARLVRGPQAMRTVGRRLARELPPGSLVALEGDLGAGKTVLTQGIAEGLGLDPRAVTSPTFALCQIHPGSVPLVHIDLYRLAGPEEIHDAGLLEWIENPAGALVVVEWFDRLAGQGPTPDVRVRIERPGGTLRRVRLERAARPG